MKVVINTKFGGFGLSEKAYEQLIAWGVPCRRYVHQKQDPDTGLYLPEPLNDGEVIFDRELSPAEEDSFAALYHKYKSSRAMPRYWDTWTKESRTHPLVIRVVETLGPEADGPFAELKIVDIPDGTDWQIDEYDGRESIHEAHRSWA